MHRESSPESDAQNLFEGASDADDARSNLNAPIMTALPAQNLAHMEQVSDDAKLTISSKKRKKRNEDAQRAFRERRAAHIRVRCLFLFDLILLDSESACRPWSNMQLDSRGKTDIFARP